MDFLSRREKEKGRRSYLLYTFVNGLGYSFLAETIIYLLAMNYGAGNMQLGYISSAVYLTGIVVFFVPLVFRNVRIIRLFFVAWMLRGVVSLAYGFTPFLAEEGAVWLIIGTYTLYCLLRNTAYPMNHVLQGYITKPSERGRYSSHVITILYASMTLSRLFSFSTLTWFGERELEGIFFLLALGIILNTAASLSITRIPVRQTIQSKSFTEAFSSFRRYLGDSQHRVLILLYCSGMSLFVLFGFTVPFLRRVLEIPSNLIFVYTTLNFAGVIMTSRFIRPYLDRFGSKPVLILGNIVLLILSLFWISAPAGMPLAGFFTLGLFTMAFMGLNRLLLDRLIVNSIPGDDRIGFTAALAVVFSFYSLFTGMAGGALADLSQHFRGGIFHEYSLTFLLLALAALGNVILAVLLKESGSLTAAQFLDLFTHPDKLKTIKRLEKLKNSSSSTRTEMILIELEADPTHLATREIHSRMKQPGLRDKEMIIRSLFSNPRPELEDDLISEALDTDSWWRQSAIFALGAYSGRRVKNTLRKIFRESGPYFQSVAAKSMARSGDFSCRHQINELLEKKNLDVRTYMNLVIAVSMMEHDGAFWSKIFRLLKESSSHRFQQSLLIIGSARAGFSPSLEEYFYELNLGMRDGFHSLFEDLVDFDLRDGEYEELKAMVEDEDFYGIWSFCRAKCKGIDLLEPYEILRQEIRSYRKRSITPTMAMAGIYFSFRLDREYRDRMDRIRSSQRAE